MENQHGTYKAAWARPVIILSDQELEVDGVIYRELKSLNLMVFQDGPSTGTVGF